MIIEYFYSHKRSPLYLITRSATVAAMAESVSTWSMRTPKTDSVGKVCLTMTGFQGMVGFDISYGFIRRAGMVENHP